MTVLPLDWSIDTNAISRAGQASFSYEASPSELEGLKRYGGVEDAGYFRADVQVRELSAGRYRISGTLIAGIVQASVVDLEALPAQIEEGFSVDYWPPEALPDADLEKGPGDADPPEALIDGRIPVGQLVCELFAVSIDPYPRKEGESFQLEPSLIKPEAGPFAELARLMPRPYSKDD